MSVKKKDNWINKVLPWVVPFLVLILWQILTRQNTIAGNILPEPVEVFKAFKKLWKSGELLESVGISTKRALLGFVVGGSIGFVLGLLNGLSPISRRLLDSTVQMFRTIPHLALIPLTIVWFGIGEEIKLFLVSLGVFFPIYLNTFHGIRTVDPALVEMGKVYGLKKLSLFKDVVLPGALPSILIGIRYALGNMWLTLIVAETIAADSGIGYLAMSAREYMLMDVVVLSIVLYALLGKLSDVIAKGLERGFLQWHPSYKKS